MAVCYFNFDIPRFCCIIMLNIYCQCVATRHTKSSDVLSTTKYNALIESAALGSKIANGINKLLATNREKREKLNTDCNLIQNG